MRREKPGLVMMKVRRCARNCYRKTLEISKMVVNVKMRQKTGEAVEIEKFI